MKKFMSWLSLVAIILGLSIGPVLAKFVEYQLDIDYKQVNFTGHTVTAIAMGDSIPAPTIEAMVGDTLRVTFHNKMDVETSVHWHGILLPQDQDGVPYLTAPPIAPGTSFTYEYPITHHGTYWYHSHAGLQEQQGVYGALVFHPKQGERVEADSEAVVVLSDWTNEDPKDVMHNLKKSDDYYALKKANVQSWLKVMEEGVPGIKQRLEGALMRMGPMDLSDVGYDAFFANGEEEHVIPDIKAGDRVRLRLVNAAASSYFSVSYAGGSMTVVAADGIDVEPFDVKRLRLAIAETFDVIVTVPEAGAYALRATSEDNTGFSRLLLGEGPLVEAPAMPVPQMMDHAMHSDSQMAGHEHHAMVHHDQHQMASDEMQEYDLLRAIEPTQFDANNPKRTVHLKLTGDMERYALLLDKASFVACPDDSIDYAVMERATNVWLVPLYSKWNDLGNWSALWEVADKDEKGNVEKGDVLAEGCSNNLFYSDDRLIAAIGLKDFVVVDTKDAVLIAPKNRVQEVKKLVSKLDKRGRTEHIDHREVLRPWGSYDSIDHGPRYQVKHIEVRSGESLSLQMHHHRAEHWIVVSGTALVQKGDEEMIVSENESVYISIGEKHRLSNPGKLPLQLIEVQSGCYLGEDDIVRYSDIYDRVENEN